MDDNAEILVKAMTWLDEGRQVALATVVSTWGSSPRPTGSKLAADENGEFIGSVSGGCVEAAVLEAANDVIQTGIPTLLEFGVSNEEAWKIGLACGGSVSIFVEKISDRAPFQEILERVGAGAVCASLSSLECGKRTLVRSDDSHLEEFQLDSEAVLAIQTACSRGEHSLVDTLNGKFFLEYWRPPLRLAIVGAVHIAQALAKMATAAGYEVTIIDPRTAFATEQRFAGFPLITDWPDEALAKFGPNIRSAVVALTHDPKIDDPALQAALKSTAFYIGALGSRKTAEKRRERLRAMGFADDNLSRVNGPAGLSIGAVTPAEIAISILAEMTAALRMKRAVSHETLGNEV